MTTLRVRTALVVLACLPLLLVAVAPGLAEEGALLTDAEGDATSDALDILSGTVRDDGAQFDLALTVKDLGGDVPDLAGTEAKAGWRMLVSAHNATDPAKARTVFVQAQVILGPDSPAPQPPGTASGPGTSYAWGFLDADGNAVLQGKLDGAALHADTNAVTFVLGFDRFKVAASGAERVDLATDGAVTGVRAETLTSPHPYYGALAEVPAWETSDDTAPAAYTLTRLRAPPAAPTPTLPTNTTSVEVALTPTNGSSAANVTGNETGSVQEADAGLPGPGAVAAIAAVAAATGALGRRPFRPWRRD